MGIPRIAMRWGHQSPASANTRISEATCFGSFGARATDGGEGVLECIAFWSGPKIDAGELEDACRSFRFPVAIALALAALARYALADEPSAADPTAHAAPVTAVWPEDPNAPPPGIWVAPSGGPVGVHHDSSAASARAPTAGRR
jgi:hypothetical protein